MAPARVKPKSKIALSSQNSTLDWPLLKPLLPLPNLSLETLLPSQVIVIRNFWTATLCKNYVNFLKTLPLTTTGAPKRGEAVRFNDRFQLQDDKFANSLWLETGLRDLICGSEHGDSHLEMNDTDRKNLWGGDVIGLNPSIRIYRYSKGQFFDQHYDESNVVSLNSKSVPTAAITTWTLLLYLTSSVTGCQGGETVFYHDTQTTPVNRRTTFKELIVSPETGMLLLHKHGHNCLLHEGRKVLAGEKWVIRTDLCVKRK